MRRSSTRLHMLRRISLTLTLVQKIMRMMEKLLRLVLIRNVMMMHLLIVHPLKIWTPKPLEENLQVLLLTKNLQRNIGLSIFISALNTKRRSLVSWQTK